LLGAAFYDVTSRGIWRAGHFLALWPNQAATFERRHIVDNDNRGVTLVSGTLLLIAVTADTHAVNGDIWKETENRK